MSQQKQKLGIMGGTFDPVHLGHLVLAEEALMELALDKVLFVPAGNPPHKQNWKVTPASHRYMMTVMATNSNCSFTVLPIELDRSGPSYTIDTIAALGKLYGTEAEFFFITGSDALSDLPNWKEAENLLGMCHFVAAARPGCNGTIDETISHFGELGLQRIHRLTTPELEISSTEIRERIRTGRSIKYIVPESVEHYILKEGLYRE